MLSSLNPAARCSYLVYVEHLKNCPACHRHGRRCEQAEQLVRVYLADANPVRSADGACDPEPAAGAAPDAPGSQG
ncbi:hypothetical protein ABTX35_08250 [Streptomyces sp. NPDC096080]|uniref:hypothetical protein n=1 Tax=Streptomyces sp. NPDC096080 TaxID=3156693 RepID=UPI00332BFF4D